VLITAACFGESPGTVAEAGSAEATSAMTSDGSEASTAAGTTPVPETSTDSTTNTDADDTSSSDGGSESTGTPMPTWLPEVRWAISGPDTSIAHVEAAAGVATDGATAWVAGRADLQMGTASDVWAAQIVDLDEGVMGWQVDYDAEAQGDSGTSIALRKSDIVVGARVRRGRMDADRALFRAPLDGSSLDLSTGLPPVPGNDVVNDVAVDPMGRIFVAGRVANAQGGSEPDDLWVGRFDPSGAMLEEEYTYDHASGNDGALGVLVGEGGVFVTGFVSDAMGRSVGWMGRFTPSLGFIEQTFIGDDASEHTLERARETASGYVIAGTSTVPGKGFDISLREVGANMGALWDVTVGGDGDDAAKDLDSAPNGDVYVCGSIRGAGSDDLWIGRFTSDGEVRGELVIAGDAGADDRAQACRTLPGGDVLVAGYLGGSANESYAYIARIGE
jgi:hypothetical protein